MAGVPTHRRAGPDVAPGGSGADTSTPVPASGDLPHVPGYEVGGLLGCGGMGVVYRATDSTLGREVAVKVLLHRFAADSGTARRFADEARITAQLQHPGIPPVHDLGTLPDGRPFLAMKLIKGSTLDHLLAARPDPAQGRGRFVAAFEQVCQAVGYAHAHNVIHRDLKPSNVMVGAFGEVQVMDWGLAKVLAARGRPPCPPDTAYWMQPSEESMRLGCVHRRLDNARRHSVHANATVRVLDRQGPRDGVESALREGRQRRRHALDGLIDERRRQVDDMSTPPREHLPDGPLRDVEEPG